MQSFKEKKNHTAVSPAAGSQAGAKLMINCVKPSFIGGGVTVVNLSLASYFYDLFQALPACILRECRRRMFLFLVTLPLAA